MDRTDETLLTTRAADDPADASLFIDAGIGHLRLRVCTVDGGVLEDKLLPSNRDLRALFDEERVAERFGVGEAARVFVTGKLAGMVQRALGGGFTFLPAGVLWLAARNLIAGEPETVQRLAVIEISASGYTLVGIDRRGALVDDLLVVNPRCGAGTGVNMDRVLQKLGIAREAVDTVLAEYLGDAGRERRARIATRADRCGVFASSATISDKNQGIPLGVALATTLKSEVLKTCRKLPAGFDKVVLAGRFFRWRFARECALDYLESIGITAVTADTDNSLGLDALRLLVAQAGVAGLSRPDPRLLLPEANAEYPPFADLKRRMEAVGHFQRQPTETIATPSAAELAATPLHLGLDVGSTMAKAALADDAGRLVFVAAYGNSGDTIETIKQMFRDLQSRGLDRLSLRSIGVTGSARFQVREALARIYPALGARIQVLVENYAHARGSIDLARQHLADLQSRGIADLNEDLCILVDIGGEDTKISTIALKEAELFNNAMNVKCSAGTGSLMDTLAALFDIPGAGEASRLAMAAGRAFEINATCAVFLMENAQKLQAQGVPREEILASANWAIVENMARTLWSQVELPRNTVVLLHGQTMLSDPLPLAVAHRMAGFLGGASFALVPSHPGHRACFGLIRTLRQTAPDGAESVDLAALLDARFEKRIIQCKGAACNDPEAVCNRASLKCQGADGKHFSFTLGGCSAINELFARAKHRKEGSSDNSRPPPRDTYKEIWDFIDQRLPRSESPDRLVIARSFVVSEWAAFLAEFFAALGLPVHVDNVRDSDLIAAQPRFNIDSCAPHMGAVGQFIRLAGEPHGIILAPQIERLDTGGASLGRTCTLNQGGVAVAANLARVERPDARFHLFSLDLSQLEAGWIADQLVEPLAPLFAHYGIAPSAEGLLAAANAAIARHRGLRGELADFAAELIEESMAQGYPVALVVGREYMLNPGIYDSHVRRLLRDKAMAAIPSYVLDVELDPEFSSVYWRNPHTIVSVLKAVADRQLHRRIRQPRLAAAFHRLESGEMLLPAVQVSTFCCGPDSVTAHLIAEIMKKRPFLLIQSDAVIKELAHLENRVNTYVRQLETGLHGKLNLGDGQALEIRALDQLENREGIDRQRDVIYIPTMADNRVLTSVLRGAGYTCIDNYAEHPRLSARVRLGRKATGDAVCAPLAGVWGDLLLALEDFERRRRQGDPLVAGKRRLLYFNNKGSGPCRQGQYVEVHKLLAHRSGEVAGLGSGGTGEGCDAVPGGQMLRFLVAHEAQGYDFGIPEWALLRMYLGSILQGVLYDMLFAGSWRCRDFAEFQRYRADFGELQKEVYRLLESYRGPGALARLALAVFGRLDGVGDAVKPFAYRLRDGRLIRALADFAERWQLAAGPATGLMTIHVSGEVYMRVAQSEEIFKTLLAHLGFGRFRMQTAPVWSYLEYLLEETADEAAVVARAAVARRARAGEPAERLAAEEQRKRSDGVVKRVGMVRYLLRNWLAEPLYRAATMPMPAAAAQTMAVAKEVLPTLRPQGELGPYIGEALLDLRAGLDLLLNVAPGSCMVSAMAETITPRLLQAQGGGNGRIQQLFSAEGEVDEELLTMAVLKTLGPEAYFRQGIRSAGLSVG